MKSTKTLIFLIFFCPFCLGSGEKSLYGVNISLFVKIDQNELLPFRALTRSQTMTQRDTATTVLIAVCQVSEIVQQGLEVYNIIGFFLSV